jgi:hypothetical protein
MKIPKLIAICGQKRSGKDTLANYIVSQYGHKNVKIAEKVKMLAKTLFGFSHDQIESDSKEAIDPNWGISPRRVMQFIGTEMFQYKIQELLPDIQRNFWIKSTIQEHIVSQSTPIVISDLRFYHEYQALKDFNVYIIKITRDRDHDSYEQDQHSSETEFHSIPSNLTIHNDTTKEQMYKTLDSTFSQIE